MGKKYTQVRPEMAAQLTLDHTEHSDIQKFRGFIPLDWNTLRQGASSCPPSLAASPRSYLPHCTL